MVVVTPPTLAGGGDRGGGRVKTHAARVNTHLCADRLLLPHGRGWKGIQWWAEAERILIGADGHGSECHCCGYRPGCLTCTHGGGLRALYSCSAGLCMAAWPPRRRPLNECYCLPPHGGANSSSKSLTCYSTADRGGQRRQLLTWKVSSHRRLPPRVEAAAT